MSIKKIIIAIDGHSSCGKSTTAKRIAKTLGYIFIDSGAMYRAVTLYAMQHDFIHEGTLEVDKLIRALSEIFISFKYDKKEGTNETYLNGISVEQEIRQLQVSQNVSLIATIKEVREAMVKQQQAMGQEKGIVMDGRDIGTVVFPNAELKIFMTASAEVRAQRRFDELLNKGEKVSYDEILKNVIDRDYIDSHRDESPLVQAHDALLLDNSHMAIEEQTEWILQKAQHIITNSHG
ncbi:MAG: (d)CMP kinase [Mangrovibacterium sp.]